MTVIERTPRAAVTVPRLGVIAVAAYAGAQVVSDIAKYYPPFEFHQPKRG